MWRIVSVRTIHSKQYFTKKETSPFTITSLAGAFFAIIWTRKNWDDIVNNMWYTKRLVSRSLSNLWGNLQETLEGILRELWGEPGSMALYSNIEVCVLRECNFQKWWIRGVVQQMLRNILAIQICPHLHFEDTSSVSLLFVSKHYFCSQHIIFIICISL